jgi:hypothetical protein
MTDHRVTPLRRAPAAATAVVFALALGACTDAPTKPAPDVPIAATDAAASAAPLALAGPAGRALLEDAHSRLLPSLAEQALRGRMQDRLKALATALDAGDEPGARRQLALTRKLVTASARRGDGADLASLTLALDEIETQLDASAAQPMATQP